MGGGAVVAGASTGREAQYQGGFTAHIFLTCCIAASGGLLFGYDNGVTGGVISQPAFLQQFFPEVMSEDASHQSTNTVWCKFEDPMLSLFTSSLFLAGAASALVGQYFCNSVGRKPVMTCAGIFFCIGAGLTAGAVNTAMLIVGRLSLGVGVGLANQSVPLYLVEVAPYKLRGAMNILFQLAVTIGILSAQLINYGTSKIQPWGWRLSLGLAGVPAVMLTFGSLFLPETPSNLCQRGKFDQARAVLQSVRGVQDVEIEFEDVVEAAEEAKQAMSYGASLILRRKYWPVLICCILIPMFQQLTGINAIMFYSPQLFASIGSSADIALIQTCIIGAVNVCSTIVAILLVDRAGRRPLFLEGGIQMIAAEATVGALLATQFDANGLMTNTMAYIVIVFICVFVAGFAWSWGPLAWLVPTEILPLEVRAVGQAVNVVVNFLLTFVIAQAFLPMLCAMEWGIFVFFAAWVCVMTVFVFFLVPETKGVPIDDVKRQFKNHKFWKTVRGGPQSGDSDFTLERPSDVKEPSAAKVV